MSTRPKLTKLTSDRVEVEQAEPDAVTFTEDDVQLFSEMLEVAKRSAAKQTAALELIAHMRKALKGSTRVRITMIPEQLSRGLAEHQRRQAERFVDLLMPDVTMPTEAQVVQFRRNAEARTELLQHFGALTAEHIGERYSTARNRHALAVRWRKEKRIFSVSYKGQTLYPGFQFDDDGAKPGVRMVLEALPTEEMSPWEVALWWTAGNGWLGGQRPVDLLGEHDEELEMAASRLSEPSPL